ncbi:hypothetical protein QBC38DRAFT_546622 [Podospora fimiseda]|uniref:Uncharacterized protein n=1 Tax=Podospora fimiseda TaxID=252190 RepID=A0AAN7BLY1_9PEZI|nr:hypothetical protein QBC38DRAFT_546622 [Podospora fimiseda]
MLLSHFLILGAAYALPQTLNARFFEKRAGSGRRYTLNQIGAYGGGGPLIDICTGPAAFTFRAGKYPSTANPQSSDAENEDDDGENDTPTPSIQSAANIPGIGVLTGFPNGGRFIDTSESITPLGGTPGKPDQNLNLQTFPIPQGPNVYHTEHVFELHIVKDFFAWLVRNSGLTASTDEMCSELFNVFGKPTSALYDQDVAGSLANEMMLQLAWHDTEFPDGLPEIEGNKVLPSRLRHFFILEAGLNKLKGKIMNGRPLDEPDTHVSVLPNPSSWNNCVKTFDQALVVMQYLRSSNVIAAWRDAAVSVQQYLDKPTVKAISGNGRPWSQLWKTFINAWVDKRSQDLQNWYEVRKDTCENLGMTDAQFQQNFGDFDQLEQFLITRWRKEEFTLPAQYKLQ